MTLVDGGANLAVHSAHASAIELCLFDHTGQREAERLMLPERSGDVFHGFVEGLVAGTRYGLRAHGPYAPHEGHRFNADKLLVDPYARALDRAFVLHPAQNGQLHDGRRDDTDSAPFTPKAIAMPGLAEWARTYEAARERARRPHRPGRRFSESIIYEMHVRGFTRLHPDVPAALRGTCAASRIRRRSRIS